MTKTTYTEMVDSGIEWIGKIPKGWEVRKLKYFMKYEKGKNAALYTNDYIGLNEGLYPVYSGQTENEGVMGKINSYDYDIENALFVTTVGAKAMTLKKINGKFSLSQNCALILPKKSNVDVSFYGYYLQSHFEYEKGMISLIMQPSLRFEDLDKYSCIFPPLTTQQAIASYLDTKTAQIDEAISLKTQQIELLREKRISLINHVVTKGLDPDVELVDSGIEWIGKIPKGWEVRKLKTITSRIGDGIHTTPQYSDEETYYYFINGNNLKNGFINISDTAKFINEDEYLNHKINLYPESSVLISINGTIGNLAFYNNEQIILGKSAAYINITKKLNKFFLYYYLQTNIVNTIFELSFSGSTINNLSLDTIRNLYTIVPPYQEQEAITSYLDIKTAEIDQTIALVQKSIDLLVEYKQSLISHVVTGKVKVV